MPSISQQLNENDISDIPCDSNPNISEPINIEEQGSSKKDAIDICASVASTETSAQVITHNITSELNLEYGNLWLSNNDHTLNMLRHCNNTSIDLVTLLFNNNYHMSREITYFYNLEYKYLQILCSTPLWLNCEIINPMM